MSTKKSSPTSPLLRAKFYCTSLDKNDDNSDNHYEHLHFAPVAGGSEENESFSKFTPSGSLEMRVTNPDLFGKVQPGDTFYLDFIPVEKEG